MFGWVLVGYCKTGVWWLEGWLALGWGWFVLIGLCCFVFGFAGLEEWDVGVVLVEDLL